MVKLQIKEKLYTHIIHTLVSYIQFLSFTRLRIHEGTEVYRFFIYKDKTDFVSTMNDSNLIVDFGPSRL